jgi:hypothetical protein
VSARRITARDVAPVLAFLWGLVVGLTVRAHGQVPSTVHLRNGQVTSTIVRNPSPVETLTVAIELRERFVAGGTVTVGRRIDALVAPATFVLAPDETQTVRLRLRERVAPGVVLGLVTTFAPASVDAAAPGSDTAPVARLVLVTRLVSKVRVVP